MRRCIASLVLLCFALQASSLGAIAAQSTVLSNTATIVRGVLSAVKPMAVIAPVSSYSDSRRVPPQGRSQVTPAPGNPSMPKPVGQRVFRTGVLLPGPVMHPERLRGTETIRDPRAINDGPVSGSFRCISSILPQGCQQRVVVPQTVSQVPTATLPSPRPSSTRNIMSGAPTVQQFQYEADTTTAPNTLFVTAGSESGAVSRIADSAPANAPTDEVLTFSPTTTAMSFGWISPANVPDMASWPAQNYTVTLNITQPNTNLKLTQITLYRVDANGGPGTAGIAHVADKTGLSQSLGTAGTLSFTLTGTADA